jgi:hypothetical protein
MTILAITLGIYKFPDNFFQKKATCKIALFWMKLTANDVATLHRRCH